MLLLLLLACQATGGDAWLHVQRLEIDRAAGAPEKARAAGLKAIELREKKYVEAAQWLSRIEKDLKIEAYAGFVKSPEYAAWMKSRGR